MNRNFLKAAVYDSCRALIVLSSLISGPVRAQTNFSAWCLVDTPPIAGTNGAADTLASGLTIGEVSDPGSILNGLYRSELIIELPPAPPKTFLSSASLSLYLEQNTGTTNGNSTFGPLQVYHRGESQFFVSDSDYSDGNFSYVAELVNPTSSIGHYYSVEVTPEIAADYGQGFATNYAKFRFQVDGLQYSGNGSHLYEFYFSSISPIYPAILDLKFEPLPFLSCSYQSAPAAIRLQWATNFGEFVLESSDSLTNSAWQSETNVPSIIDDHFVVDVEAKVEQQFFRLRRSP